MPWPFIKKKKKKKLTGMAAAGQTSGKPFEGNLRAGMSAIKKRRQRMSEMQKELGS